MKKLFTLLGCLSFFLQLVPLASYGQCANQITVNYYNNGVLTSQTINNGQSGTGASVCPTAGAQYTFNGSSTSNAVLTWARVITHGATPGADVVEIINSAPLTAGNTLSTTVSFTTATEYRLESDANAYGGCNKDGFVYFTFTPALSLSSSGTSSTTGVCAGSSVTLTASGASSGGYTWKANGVTVPGQNSATLSVTPAVTTTYTVEATTSCGQSSQQITIPVKDVTIAPAAPAICPSQSTTLTASYSGTSATYQWFIKGDATVRSTGSSLTVTPATTTTYQVVATTADCNTITRDVTVTVGPQKISVSTGPSAAICPGGSVPLTATSDNPGATFTWSPNTGLNTTTGATVTASPTANTTYTVTATTPCGATATSQVTVSIVSPTFAVTPSTPSTCAGDAVTLTASSGGITNTTYKWYNTTNLGTLLSSSATFSPAPVANTTYRVITATPCGNNSQDVTVTVNAKPTVSVSPTSATTDPTTSTTLTASGSGPYAWTATTGGNTIPLAATTASITVSPKYTTTYAVTTTNAAGCSATAQALVTVSRPLPVTLVSFEAAWAGKTPVLTWATASEKNSAYFDIERSFNGEGFEAVGRVTAAGNANARINYQFADQSLRLPAAGQVYYRLNQVDVTGERTYSPVQTLTTAKEGAAFEATAYPNPFDSKVAVQLFTPQAGDVALTLHNLMGQTVLTHTLTATPGTQEVVLPLADRLPAGIYYLTVRQGNTQQVLRLSHR
ncbi:Ig-like domain-containing protein [Hymenobacter properus]|uniref:T9SS type A sorting domain-containing protein n=1 Tax=Hymenobacter properus TaxID=2791026 RepID=A0A931BFY4_9BACT|nr:T9SS type A sorting domain-containing protein [Hymenobacter properus]MBF9143195.1 T9SS type A sorting domain-containing protein [Hymenobacter properus]MBR7722004.1 T9SS type A sorting domain-containing protein [Microvirga sp. SRT04]